MRLLARSLTLGLASGGRSSLGPGAPAIASGGRVAMLSALVAIAGEVAADKLPSTPSRLEPAPLAARCVAGGVGGVVLARRAGASPVVPALLGACGAVLGSYAGAAWRAWATDRSGPWPAAVAEDLASSALALWVARSD